MPPFPADNLTKTISQQYLLFDPTPPAALSPPTSPYDTRLYLKWGMPKSSSFVQFSLLLRQETELSPALFQLINNSNLEAQLWDSWSITDEYSLQQTSAQELNLLISTIVRYGQIGVYKPSMLLPTDVKIGARDVEDEFNMTPGMAAKLYTLTANPAFWGREGLEFLQYMLRVAVRARMPVELRETTRYQATAMRDQYFRDAFHYLSPCGASVEEVRKIAQFVNGICGLLPSRHLGFVLSLINLIHAYDDQRFLRESDVDNVLRAWDIYVTNLQHVELRLNTTQEYEIYCDARQQQYGDLNKLARDVISFKRSQLLHNKAIVLLKAIDHDRQRKAAEAAFKGSVALDIHGGMVHRTSSIEGMDEMTRNAEWMKYGEEGTSDDDDEYQEENFEESPCERVKRRLVARRVARQANIEKMLF
ncbi:hypothetical protein BJ875DRAFT_547569 [Amylocarpus encephaloides]|uniref:Uncharacterized protein n=1 Tax=Amylocarpus encephaloides TaxID=45428 RepID=A0A9P8C0A8_9HELO|nr:hypothetical protein BJ875DRAFT_547569 [Amylocarpus encephaloides]